MSDTDTLANLLRRLVKKSPELTQAARSLLRETRERRGKVGLWMERHGSEFAAETLRVAGVRGRIGDTDAYLTWNYGAVAHKGFVLEFTDPAPRKLTTATPYAHIDGLAPGTAYRGVIRSLDTPEAECLFGFWTRPPYATGYALPLSTVAGANIDVFISSHTPEVNVKLVSLLERTHVVGEWNVAAGFQYAPYDAPQNGCQWRRSLEVSLPADLEPGVYVFDIQSQDTGPLYSTPVVVRPQTPVELAVVLSTDTWNAYNNWGGLSYYDNFINAASPVWGSLERPIYLADPWSTGAYHLGVEAHVLRHFARHGFRFGVYSDEDLAAGRVEGCKTLVMVGHNEYWCDEKLAAFDRMQAAGVNMFVLSGNNMYRHIVRDPLRTAASRYALFADRDVCPRLGTIYDARGRETGAPFRVTTPGHWIFEGTGVTEQTLFGAHDNPQLGASGLETDKRTVYSPPGVEVVARGTNSGDGGAEWVVFKHEKGGMVINAGSMSVSLHAADPVVDRMLVNVLKRLGHRAETE